MTLGMQGEAEKPIKVAVWWGDPCKAISGVFRELAAHPGFELRIFLVSPLDADRTALGWRFPDYGKATVTQLPAGKDQRRGFMQEYDSHWADIHLFNSAYRWREMNWLIDHLMYTGGLYAILTEGPFNQYRGPLRWLKWLYLAVVLPFRTRRRSSGASFVASLSGDALGARRWLRHTGFVADRIFRFGYFSEPPEAPRGRLKTFCGVPRLLCTGYLTKNKGHQLLVKAIANLRDEGVQVRCIITGFGPERVRLERQIRKLALTGQVELVGVLESVDLQSLLRDSDLLVAPGYEEPWGIRVIEALQAGVPVLASDRVGAAEVMLACGGGMTFKAGSIRSLVEQLRILLTGDRVLVDLQNNLMNSRGRLHPRVPADYLGALIRKSRDPGLLLPRPGWIDA